VSEEDVKNGEQLDLLGEVLPEVIAAFKKLDDNGKRKLFRTIGTLFELRSDFSSNGDSSSGVSVGRFSKEHPISPKEFLQKKQPRTDVERVATLAYYLAHYREQQYFKTLDISKLNTEAAQVKFSNPAKAVDNATVLGYLAPASKGNKQISAPGEVFVEALPDRAAAQAAMAASRPRRKFKRAPRLAS
jgi:hypothetical protein